MTEIPAAVPVVTDSTKVPESTPPVIPPIEPKKELDSARFASLAKKESAIVRERAAIKAERDKMAAERAEIAAEREKARKLLDAQMRAQQDPDEAFKLLGWDYGKLTEYQLKDKTIPPEIRERSLEERLRADFEKRLEAKDKEYAERMQADRKEKEAKAVEDFKSQTESYLVKNKDKYPLTNHPKCDMQYALDTIATVINNHYYNTAQKDEAGNIIKPGEIMSVADAAAMFENHIKTLAQEFHSYLEPKSEGAAADPKVPTRQEKVTEPSTITNQMASSMASNLPAKTEADRIKRAMAALG